jgi:hypothetical protein
VSFFTIPSFLIIFHMNLYKKLALTVASLALFTTSSSAVTLWRIAVGGAATEVTGRIDYNRNDSTGSSAFLMDDGLTFQSSFGGTYTATGLSPTVALERISYIDNNSLIWATADDGSLWRIAVGGAATEVTGRIDYNRNDSIGSSAFLLDDGLTFLSSFSGAYTATGLPPTVALERISYIDNNSLIWATAAAVPEPSSTALLGLGTLGLLLRRRR